MMHRFKKEELKRSKQFHAGDRIYNVMGDIGHIVEVQEKNKAIPRRYVVDWESRNGQIYPQPIRNDYNADLIDNQKLWTKLWSFDGEIMHQIYNYDN